MLLSVAFFGWGTWQAFIATAGASHTMYESGRILFGGFVSPFGAMRLMRASVGISYAVQAVFTVVAGAVVAIDPSDGGVLAPGAERLCLRTVARMS